MTNKLLIGMCIMIMILASTASAVKPGETLVAETSSVARIIGNDPYGIINQLDTKQLDIEHATHLFYRLDRLEDITSDKMIEAGFPENNIIKGQPHSSNFPLLPSNPWDVWYGGYDSIDDKIAQFQPNELFVLETFMDPDDFGMYTDVISKSDKIYPKDVADWKQRFSETNPLFILNTETSGLALPDQPNYVNELTRYSTIIAPTDVRSADYTTSVLCNLYNNEAIGDVLKRARTSYYSNTKAGNQNLIGVVLKSYVLYGNPLTRVNVPDEYEEYLETSKQSWFSGFTNTDRWFNPCTKYFIPPNEFVFQGFGAQSLQDMTFANAESFDYSITGVNNDTYHIINSSKLMYEYDNPSITGVYTLRTHRVPKGSIVDDVQYTFSNPAVLNIPDYPSSYGDNYTERNCFDSSYDEGVVMDINEEKYYDEIVLSINPLRMDDCEDGNFTFFQDLSYSIKYIPVSQFYFNNLKYEKVIGPGSDFQLYFDLEYVSPEDVNGTIQVIRGNQTVYTTPITQREKNYTITLPSVDYEGTTEYSLQYVWNNTVRTEAPFEVETKYLDAEIYIREVVSNSAPIDVSIDSYSEMPASIKAELIDDGSPTVIYDQEVSLSKGNNVFSFQANNLLKQAGSYSLVVYIDAANERKTYSDIIVTNHAPVVNVEDVYARIGDLIELDYDVYDPDNDTVTVQVTGNKPDPWYAEASDLGSTEISISADDGIATTEHVFYVHVIEENYPPELFQHDNVTISEGDVASVIFYAQDIDGDNLTYSIGHENFTKIDYNWFEWYTWYGNAGLYNISYTVTDGTVNASKSFWLTVNPGPDLCANITCEDKCSGPNRYENGTCSYGYCEYQNITINSTVCNATQPPVNNSCENITCADTCNVTTKLSNGACSAGACIYTETQDAVECGYINPVVCDSTFGQNWVQATDNAAWPDRSAPAYAIFNNKMWLFGGQSLQGSEFYKDAWSSTDGITWTQETASAQWAERAGHDVLVYDNRLWLMGGWNPSNEFNDVWYSDDGINWNLATSSAPWSARDRFMPMVYDNKMWVMGGHIGNGLVQNDVWYSTDGATWTQATSSAQWPARMDAGNTIFDNKMWIIGGAKGYSEGYADLNDAWYSTDGMTWTPANYSAAWTPRTIGGGMVAASDKIWILGGVDGIPLNDVWSSSDGASWNEVTSSALWPEKTYGASFFYDNKMWIMAGTTLPPYTGVWYSECASIPQTCANITCLDTCNGTTRLTNGACNAGVCGYTEIPNSTECGYVPPVNDTNTTINQTQNDTCNVLFRTNAQNVSDYWSSSAWVALDKGSGLNEYTTALSADCCSSADPTEADFIAEDSFGVRWYKPGWTGSYECNPYRIQGMINGSDYVCLNLAGGPSCYGATADCPYKGAELSPYPTEPYMYNQQEAYKGDCSIPDPCENITCSDTCNGTTSLTNGACSAGLCTYTETPNSTDCGYEPPADCLQKDQQILLSSNGRVTTPQGQSFTTGDVNNINRIDLFTYKSTFDTNNCMNEQYDIKLYEDSTKAVQLGSFSFADAEDETLSYKRIVFTSDDIGLESNKQYYFEWSTSSSNNWCKTLLVPGSDYPGGSSPQGTDLAFETYYNACWIPPVNDPCENITCADTCNSTTRLTNGICNAGECSYTETVNSTECGYEQPGVLSEDLSTFMIKPAYIFEEGESPYLHLMIVSMFGPVNYTADITLINGLSTLESFYLNNITGDCDAFLCNSQFLLNFTILSLPLEYNLTITDEDTGYSFTKNAWINDSCAGITCADTCDNTTRLTNGTCFKGECSYDLQENSTECGYVPLECYADNDCPLVYYQSDNYCNEGGVYYNRSDPVCMNPGEQDAYCEYVNHPYLNEECEFGCEAGACIVDPCENVSCDSSCYGTTRLYNGICDLGQCSYTEEPYSTECGYTQVNESCTVIFRTNAEFGNYTDGTWVTFYNYAESKQEAFRWSGDLVGLCGSCEKTDYRTPEGLDIWLYYPGSYHFGVFVVESGCDIETTGCMMHMYSYRDDLPAELSLSPTQPYLERYQETYNCSMIIDPCSDINCTDYCDNVIHTLFTAGECMLGDCTYQEILNSSDCGYVEPACYQNADCGTDGPAGDPVCVGNDIRETYVTNICMNPGTAQAECTSMNMSTSTTCTYLCDNASCIDRGPCTDSDGGRNYFERGVTAYEGIPSAGVDQCDNETTLSERYCDNNDTIQIESHDCKFGCADGACHQDPCLNITCPDYCDNETYNKFTSGSCLLGSCTYQEINNSPECGFDPVCTINSDCGIDYNATFCDGYDQMGNITIHECINPGTMNSYCNETSNIIMLNQSSIECGYPTCPVVFRTDADNGDYNSGTWVAINPSRAHEMTPLSWFKVQNVGCTASKMNILTPQGTEIYGYTSSIRLNLINNPICDCNLQSCNSAFYYGYTDAAETSLGPVEPYSSEFKEVYAEGSTGCPDLDKPGGSYCTINSECDSDNCSNNVCEYQPQCYSDSECGTDSYVGDQYCMGSDIKQIYRTFTCSDPGEWNASCSYVDSEHLINTCVFGCDNGVCNPDPCDGVVCSNYCDGYTLHSRGICHPKVVFRTNAVGSNYEVPQGTWIALDEGQSKLNPYGLYNREAPMVTELIEDTFKGYTPEGYELWHHTINYGSPDYPSYYIFYQNTTQGTYNTVDAFFTHPDYPNFQPEVNDNVQGAELAPYPVSPYTENLQEVVDYKQHSCEYVLHESNSSTCGFNPECSSDSDCNAMHDPYYSQDYCLDGDVYQNSTTGTCVNPGSMESYCEPVYRQNMIEECAYGCEAGACIADPCSNITCEDYCGGNDGFDYYHDGVCSLGECDYSISDNNVTHAVVLDSFDNFTYWTCGGSCQALDVDFMDYVEGTSSMDVQKSTTGATIQMSRTVGVSNNHLGQMVRFSIYFASQDIIDLLQPGAVSLDIGPNYLDNQRITFSKDQLKPGWNHLSGKLLVDTVNFVMIQIYPFYANEPVAMGDIKVDYLMLYDEACGVENPDRQDQCLYVTCPNTCNGTTQLSDGACNAGACKYTETFNSTECGFVPDCSSDSDCNDLGFNTTSCFNGTVMINRTSGICHNPGTAESFCDTDSISESGEQCSIACSNGQCLNESCRVIFRTNATDWSFEPGTWMIFNYGDDVKGANYYLVDSAGYNPSSIPLVTMPGGLYDLWGFPFGHRNYGDMLLVPKGVDYRTTASTRILYSHLASGNKPYMVLSTEPTEPFASNGQEIYNCSPLPDPCLNVVCQEDHCNGTTRYVNGACNAGACEYTETFNSTECGFVLPDPCLNITCPSGYCQEGVCVEYVCRENTDCGTDGFIGDAFCTEDSLQQTYRTYTCLDPSTADASCNYTESDQTIEECGFGCENASCSRDPCTVIFRTNAENGDYGPGTWIAVDYGEGMTAFANRHDLYGGCPGGDYFIGLTPEGYHMKTVPANLGKYVNIKPDPAIDSCYQHVTNETQQSIIDAGGIAYEWVEGVIDNAVLSTEPTPPYSYKGQEVYLGDCTIADPCDNLTCDNHCQGTTRFINGICQYGECSYDEVFNSTECGWIDRDLYVESGQLLTPSPKINFPTTFKYGIKNSGTIDVDGVNVMLDTNSSDSNPKNSGLISIAAGQTKYMYVYVNYSQPGSYITRFIVDWDNMVDENNEDNNEYPITIEVTT